MAKRALMVAVVLACIGGTAPATAHVLSMSRARSKALDVGARIATEYNANQDRNNRYVQLASDRTHCYRAGGRSNSSPGSPVALGRVRHKHKVICNLYYFRHHLMGSADDVDYCTLLVTIKIKGRSQRLHASHPASFSCSAAPQA